MRIAFRLALLFLSCILPCCGPAKQSGPAATPLTETDKASRPASRQEEDIDRVYALKLFSYLTEKDIARLTGEAERGDKNSAAHLWAYYGRGVGDKKKAAYFLNIAGRGGEGVGQYGIPYYYRMSEEGKKRYVSYLSDKFLLSEELVQMLEQKVEQGDAEAAARLAEHYSIEWEDRRKRQYYYLLAGQLGHPQILQDLESRYSPERLKILFEQNAAAGGFPKP